MELLRRLPSLEAEERLKRIGDAQIGAGLLKKSESASILQQLERQIHAGRERKLDRTAVELRLMTAGISVERK